MAKANDSYKVKLRMAHLGWGTHRNTLSRARRPGEAYIPIPAKYARKFNILNSNGTDGNDVFGMNLFNCESADGLFSGVLKAQGSPQAGNIFAKQFSVNNDLQAIGKWYERIGAQVDDTIRITWTSETDIVIEKI